MVNFNTVSSIRTVTAEFEKEFFINGNRFVLYEEFVNNELTTQYVKSEKHNGYEPKSMRFCYYGGKLDLDKVYKDWYKDNKFPIQKFVLDWDKFTDFDNLYAVHLNMDKLVYKLTEFNPPEQLKSFSLWGSVFDIDGLEKYLQTDLKASDIRKTNNCYANYDISGTHKLDFYYKLTSEQILKIKKLGPQCHCDPETLEILGIKGFVREIKEKECITCGYAPCMCDQQ